MTVLWSFFSPIKSFSRSNEDLGNETFDPGIWINSFPFLLHEKLNRNNINKNRIEIFLIIAGNGPGYDFVAALAATRPWQVAPERSSNEISLLVLFLVH